MSDERDERDERDDRPGSSFQGWTIDDTDVRVGGMGAPSPVEVRYPDGTVHRSVGMPRRAMVRYPDGPVEIDEVVDGSLTFGRLQREVRAWSVRNFGDRATHQPLLGAMEELGELAHAHLKQEQGIRGTAAEHEAAAKDAIGDIIVFLADYAGGRGWDLGEIVSETWGQVRKRDWRRDPLGGKAEG